MNGVNALIAGAILGAAAFGASVSHSNYQRPPKARRTKDQRAKANQARKARQTNKGRK